jgi:hypothetical protein
MALRYRWIRNRTAYIITVVLITAIITVVVISLLQRPNMFARSNSLRAIDSANVITDANWFKKAYDEGFRLYIMHSTTWGTCDPWPRTQLQLSMALDAGLKIAVYTRDPQCWQQGIEATGRYQHDLQFFALDVETDPGIAITRSMVDGIKKMNVRPVIYTSAAMWPQVQGVNTENFADVALWEATPSDVQINTWQADYLSPTPLVFSGWNTSSTMRIGAQQQLEYTLNGVKVDLNSYDKQFIR